MLKTSRSETIVQANERNGTIEITLQGPYDAESKVLFTLRHVQSWSSELEIVLPADSMMKIKKAGKEVEVGVEATTEAPVDIPF